MLSKFFRERKRKTSAWNGDLKKWVGLLCNLKYDGVLNAGPCIF